MLQAFVIRTQNRSSKLLRTGLAPQRWHEMIIERAATSLRGAETTIKVAIETISVAALVSKALTLDPVPEPAKTTFVKILDDMDNKVKEKLPNYRDDNNGVLLVKFCQKAIAICEMYALYN